MTSERTTAVRSATGERRFGPVQIITLYLVLMFVLPARLIVPGIGSAGTPATLVGILAFVAWGTATLLGQRQFSGRNTRAHGAARLPLVRRCSVGRSARRAP